MLPQMIRGLGKRDAAARAAELLSYLGLKERLTHRPAELSGGEQQRVAIARALANDPVVLIADEPTGNLDERATRGIFQLLRDINASGTAVIMATHDLDLIRRAECLTIEMNHGAIVFDTVAPSGAGAARGKDAP
jgi:ABC-type ATPase involved in cell division